MLQLTQATSLLPEAGTDRYSMRITPHLNTVDPVTNKIVLGFGIFNIIIGIGLFTLSARTLNFFIVNDLFTEQFWGIVFILNGIVQLTGIVLNYWKVIRVGLLTGFTIMLFWSLALGVRQLESFDTNIFLLCFFAICMYVKLVLYIHFPDKKEVDLWTHK